MTGLSPFMSALLGLWILRERVASITWIAMAIALIGMLIILSAGGGQGSAIGTALAIYSAFCFSCYAVLLRWGQNTEMTVALVWNALFLIAVSTFVLLVPTGLREMTPQPFLIGWGNFAACVALGSVQVTLGLGAFHLRLARGAGGAIVIDRADRADLLAALGMAGRRRGAAGHDLHRRCGDPGGDRLPGVDAGAAAETGVKVVKPLS